MKLKSLKNRVGSTIFISSIIMIILFLFSPGFTIINKEIQKKLYQYKNAFSSQKVNTNIILVHLDNTSIEQIGSFPFSRSVYAELLSNLSAYSPSVIALDFLFLDASDSTGDLAFAQAVQDFGRVVFGAGISSEGEILYPLDTFAPDITDSGVLPPNVEKTTNTVFSFSPYFQDIHGDIQEHFTLSILRKFYSYFYNDPAYLESGFSLDDSYYLIDGIHYPYSSSSSEDILINYVPGYNFPNVSFVDLLEAEKLKEIDELYGLQDAVILIGPAADGFNDEFYTPNGREYGMYIHANILNTLMQGKFMLYFDKRWEWMMLFCLTLMSTYINLSRKTREILIGNILMIGVFLIAFPLLILLGTNLFLNFLSEFIFALLLSSIGANVVKFIVENFDKNKLNSALSEYVSTDIAEEILQGSGKIKLDGEQRELICFFSDIEGFTSLSESLSPTQLVAFLRDYLSIMTHEIIQAKGHVDKYEGDAIMAMWGAFSELTPQSFIDSCQQALRQQALLKQLNIKWKHILAQEIKVRMGIHAGSAIVGNIGAVGEKMDFTALGDNVNLASRLEGINKYYGTYICVSESVYQKTKEHFSYRFLDLIRVKGKSIPVKIYELRAHKDVLDQKENDFIRSFDEAQQLYAAREFQKAYKLFFELSHQDVASYIFMKRCEDYVTNPPADDWDGVYTFQAK